MFDSFFFSFAKNVVHFINLEKNLFIYYSYILPDMFLKKLVFKTSLFELNYVRKFLKNMACTSYLKNQLLNNFYVVYYSLLHKFSKKIPFIWKRKKSALHIILLYFFEVKYVRYKWFFKRVLVDDKWYGRQIREFSPSSTVL